MIKISIKKIVIVFAILVLLSRSKYIIEFFSDLDLGDTLTLAPLQNCSEASRYVVTCLLLALGYVIFWRLFLKNR